MKKPFYKKWYFWTHAILLLVLGFSFFVIYRLAETNIVNEKKIAKLEKTQENKTTSGIRKTISDFTSRFDEELSVRAIKFYLNKDQVVSSFGDEVKLGGGYLTINKPNNDKTRMLATTTDFKNKIIVPIEFKNTTGETKGFDTRDIFAYNGDETISFDSVSSENLDNDGYSVVVKDGETAAASIVFGTNSKIKDIKVRYNSGLWK
ncbi:hypothetical protein [Streptococcus agalactiae]|uniref:hypothetical protein n=1 Tax=Streptococcus agalactiae TaxID=1311 RepID=UPI0005DCA868|nr:hypothetical protein [Streptococcus agalactiae]KLL36805.1 hypothetical protein WA19_08315 [Streptococcus agalactiae]CNI84764.1 Uncharacterised protein [Streptococcus agalactiae]